MNVLLIQNDIRRKETDFNDLSPYVCVNLLATVLKNAGHNVEILDPLKLQLFQKEQIKLIDFIKQLITKHNIHLVGISVLLNTRIQAINISEEIKRYTNNKVIIVLGGAGASLLYEQILRKYHKIIDYIVIGEGEETFKELVNNLGDDQVINKLKGISYFKNKKVIVNPKRPQIKNLDNIPFPDYTHYFESTGLETMNTINISTTRGCPYHCSHCGTNALWGNIRFRSPQNVINEIKINYKKFHIKKVRFNDDSFGINRKQSISILQNIINEEIDIELYAHTRFDLINDEFMRLYKQAGGQSLYLGLETASERIKKIMNRQIPNDLIREKCKLLKQHNIKFGVFILFGYPEETSDDIKQTYDLLKEIQPDDVYCSITKIQPRTELYNKAIEKGLINDETWFLDKREFFTFLTNNDQELLLKAFEIIFYEKFSHYDIRNICEKNNDLIDLDLNSNRFKKMKEKAISLLS